MIGVPFIFSAILFSIVWIVFRINYYKKIKALNISREIFINLFFIYFLILVNLTLFKYGELMLDFNPRFYVNYIPFKETINMFTGEFSDIHSALYNVIGNIVLFIPLGFSLSLFLVTKNKLTKIILYGFLTSLSIEAIQFFTPNNFTDIDDIIFNTLGTILGFIIFNIIYIIFKNSKIGDLIKTINTSYNDNLVLNIAKPIGTMILLFIALCFSLLYSQTISCKLTDNDLALEVFGTNSLKNYKVSKDFGDYKFFLSDNDEFIDLKSLKKVFINRFYKENFNSSFDIKLGNYSIMTLYENNLISGVAFGKNIDAHIIEITFKGTKYMENLIENEYFIVPFSNFEKVEDLIDFYNFFDGEESLDLQINFYHKDGTECEHLNFNYN